MLASSSTWSAISFLSILFTIAYGQGCGGTIEAGAGVIRSPNYPGGYPVSDCVWTVRSGNETRIRFKFQARACSGDSLWIYDGNGTVGVPLLGQYCFTDPPASIDSSGRVMTIKFVSLGGSENNQGFVISYESIDIVLGSRVIWSEHLPSTGEVRLNSVSADPTEMLNPDGTIQEIIGSSFYFTAPSGNWTALATRYGQHELVWSGGLRKAIIKAHMGRELIGSIYYTFTSSSVLGVAVDWLTGNIYWTDAAYDWIIMHDATGTRDKLIIDEDLDIPTGIAIHPSRGYIFWTDAGSRPKVERSNLAGNGRLELVSTDIVRPSGIAIDYETGLVYWVDADPSRNRIEVCNLEGAHRRTLMHSTTNLGLFDLTISGNYIYTSAKEIQSVMVVMKDSGQELLSMGLQQYIPYGIVTYAPDVQPQQYSPCSSNPCSFLCVGDGQDGYTCLCGNGFLLKEDGQTCEKEGTIDPPQYFVASRSKLCRYPINFPDLIFPMLTNFNVTCFLERRHHAVAIAVDLEDGIVFYSDLGLRGIGMGTLRDGSPVRVITGGVRAVQGLAVDWMTKHLYWTDHARGTIEVSKYDGSYRTTLIKDNVIKPRSIAIDPERKFMFWTEFGPPTQIERASLDGTARVVIMSSPFGQSFFVPTGLAIDTEEQRLYYADLSTRTINKADYFGNNKRQILRRNGAVFFDVALYKDYILWTELGRNNGIYASNRHTGQIVQEFHERQEQVYGITTYADTRQKMMNHPCRYQNGGCDQLCLSSTSNQRGFVCNCTLGFFLDNDGKSCVSDLVRDNFFLVTDTYRRAVFQVDLQSTLEPKALYLPSIQNPIAVSFDPIDRKVYWTDVGSHTLSRASLDGNNYQVIARDGVEHPDGIAVDPISRLLYWTDIGTHTLSVSHLDGSNRKILIRGLDKPRALVLHPTEGTMFWTDWGDNPVIERALMDGTQRSVIVSGSLRWPNGLTIDYDGNRLYWCDGGLERLETAEFDGRGRRLLHAFGRDVHAYDVAVLGQFLYWTDWTVQSVLKIDKHTGRVIETVGPNDYLRPNGIFMVSDSSMPAGDNPCSDNNGGCTGLCLPLGFDRNCTCADGFQFDEDGETCVSDQVTECPLAFHNGFIDELCDRRPGQRCDVRCFDGFVPSIDAVVCQTSGTWDRDEDTLCMPRRCGRLELPPHATSGPCVPPYNIGKKCTHTCMAGYTQTGGDGGRICDVRGEWLGTPIRCQQQPSGRTPNCNPDLMFIEAPQNLLRAEGKSIDLTCQVNDQDATIAWFKDGERLHTGSRNDIFIDQHNHLIILIFSEGLEGQYACVVMSGDTECMRSEARIALDPASYFSVVPHDEYKDIGGSHIFYCSPREDTWSVIWKKDDKPLENPHIVRGNLWITHITDANAGKYTCVARDQYGRSKGQVHAMLRLTDPPQIDISTVCGTITYWRENKTQTAPAPEVATIEANNIGESSSIDWISSSNAAGRSSGRVVGGDEANHGSAPYMVRIMEKGRFRGAPNEWTTICGGTLLDQRWVLTAAHCMYGTNKRRRIPEENLNLFFGDYDTTKLDCDTTESEATERSRQPAEIIVHERFNKRTFHNDIALIRIDPPIWEFTDYIRPICLAPGDLSSRILQTDMPGRVNGWGQESVYGPTTRFMKAVELPIVDRQKCSDSIDRNEGEFTNSMFCAGYHSAARDACQGDSGGPFAIRHSDGRWYQIGIVSWGIGCAEKGEYGFYTQVSRFLHWLRSKNVTVAYSRNVERRFNESQSRSALAFRVKSPSNLTVAEGSAIDLECVPNRHDASVSWFIGNSPDPVDKLEAGVHILPLGLVFRFDATQADYAREYSCEATVDDSEGRQAIRATFHLEVTPA